MKYPITNARRRPYIGPAPTNTHKHVATALIVVAGALAFSYAVTWIACEIKNLH